MFLLDLFQGVWGKYGRPLKLDILFWGGFLLGDSNAEKWGGYQKKKLFINNSTKAVILFKEKHQGLLKLHVPLGEGGVPVSPSNKCWGCPETNFNSQISTSYYYHHHHYHQEFTKTEGSICFTKT